MNTNTDNTGSNTPALPQSVVSAAEAAATALPKNASMEANSLPSAGDLKRATEDKLLDMAKEEGRAANRRMNDGEMAAEREGYKLVQLMSALGHKFINPKTGAWSETAFKAFLEKHNHKKHGSAKTNWQVIAKITLPQSAPSPRVTKFGQALSGLHKAGVATERVIEALTAAPDRDHDDKAMHHSGLQRYILLSKEQGGGNKPPAGSNRYITMDAGKLRAEALLVLDGLKHQGIATSTVEALKAELLRDQK